MLSPRALVLGGLAALVAGGACAFNTSGTMSSPGSGGSTSSSSSGGAASSSSSASSTTSSSTSASSTSSSSTSTSASSSGMYPPHCSDGSKNMGETDLDCGGPDCAPCAVGAVCKTGTDCALGFCSQGICCGTACTTPCLSCNAMDNTLGVSGMCLPVKGNVMDPDNRCAKGTCDGTGNCHCANAITDFDETGLNCGGSCGKCIADTCGKDSDCASGHCSDGVCCNEDCGAMGQCYSCAVMGGTWVGTCTPVFTGTQGSCPGGNSCTPSHTCSTLKANNQGCTSDGQCASNYCWTSGGTPDFKCHSRGPAGDPCTSMYQCISLNCDTLNTHLCQ